MKQIILILSFLIISGSFVKSQTLLKKDTLNTAFLIVDIQDCYFDGGSRPLEGSIEASLNAKLILEKFRELKKEVIHVMHNAKCEIHKNVYPLPDEKVFKKDYANSFLETGLLDYLHQKKIKRLVICGMQTHMCLDAAVRAAKDYGFDCVVIHDACATRKLQFGDKIIPASEVHCAFMAALSGTYAKVMSTKEFLDN
jgi:nicotinamidase-related amidase